MPTPALVLEWLELKIARSEETQRRYKASPNHDPGDLIAQEAKWGAYIDVLEKLKGLDS